jgi:undecaprenyl diphosphate synthase
MSYSLEKINHVAIIMDGNGRWAKKNSVKKKAGHHAGINTAIKICKSISNDSVINYLTLYAFSTENWKRSPQEIKQLFELINITYKKFKNTAIDQNIKIVHLGKKKKLPNQTINIVNDVVESTKMNNGLTLNIALNYGGRSEIIDAFKKFKNTNLNISEKNFYKFLYNPDLPDPEIIIRTGGDSRISNFLLWQSAYSELFFTKTLWPDFNYTKLKKIINNFYKRRRNFGK